jgi:hypothetical protein
MERQLDTVMRPVQARPSVASPLPCFTFGAFALHFVFILIWLVGWLVWLDLINANPNRTLSGTLSLMTILPLYAFIFVLVLSELSVFVGAIGAWAACKVWGRVPLLAVLLVIWPLCVGAMAFQGLTLFPDRSGAEIGDAQHSISAALATVGSENLAVLLGCLWCYHLQRARLARSVSSD